MFGVLLLGVQNQCEGNMVCSLGPVDGPAGQGVDAVREGVALPGAGVPPGKHDGLQGAIQLRQGHLQREQRQAPAKKGGGGSVNSIVAQSESGGKSRDLAISRLFYGSEVFEHMQSDTMRHMEIAVKPCREHKE